MINKMYHWCITDYTILLAQNLKNQLATVGLFVLSLTMVFITTKSHLYNVLTHFLLMSEQISV